MMTERKKRLLKKIKYNPVAVARLLGFTKLTSLHNKWLKAMITGKKDKTLQAHRGSYKTTCVSVALMLIIILYPNKRTVFIRKTDADVKEIIAQVSKMLKTELIKEFVYIIWGCPLVLTVDNATQISTNLTDDMRGAAQLVGMGIGGSMTGKHFDYIFTDDIVNVQDRVSKADRDRTKLVYQELQNIKNRDGRIFNTGTPWHKDDCFTLMPNIERYDCYETGLISPEELQQIKEGMTNSLFAANYELKHVAEDDIIFDNPQLGAQIEHVYNGYSHVDAAYYGEDWTAFTIIKIHEGKFYVFGKCWRKHIDDVMDEVTEWHSHFLCEKMYCELNADKGYVAREFRKRGVRVSTYNERENKYIKITSHLKFNWKDVIFVSGTDDKYIEQICDYNENASHDDCPDSLASLIRKLERKKNRYYEDLSRFN